MHISIIGVGYVGLVSGTCFAEMGNKVTCVDIDRCKIEKLNKGVLPIYEPGLESLVSRNIVNKTLSFTSDLQDAIGDAEVVFIAVGTPMSFDGSADIHYVLEVAKSIGKNMQGQLVVVNKSTVPVGTADKVRKVIQKELDNRKVEIEFDIVSNPEFLKEGAAVQDFMRPDRVIIGAELESTFKIMKQLYSPFFRTHERFISMDIRSAEMTKYAANAMLATKISFINEIANICEYVGADANQVRIGIGSDTRIGYDFIYPGIGYGGTCFPKDVAALIHTGNEKGYEPNLLRSVVAVNENQKNIFLQKVLNRFNDNLKGVTFAIWGLSFKPETDDMREAPAIYLIKELIQRGAIVKAYDPKAMFEAKNIHLSNISVFYGENKYEVIESADALLLLTEWKEFRSPDFEEIKKKMKQAIIFDGRNQYRTFELQKKEFEYYQMGKK